MKKNELKFNMLIVQHNITIGDTWDKYTQIISDLPEEG